MKKMTKGALSAVLCGAIALTACSCGANTTTALTIDGTEIPAGVYICYQMDALSEAQTVLAEEQPDLDMTAEGFDIKAQTIEGKNAEEWIKDKTIDFCRSYVATDRLFEEYGLSLDSHEKDEIKNAVASAWDEENIYAQYIYGFDTIGEYYESLGVGRSSYEKIQTHFYKQTAVFNHIYGEGGSLEVPAAEIDASIVNDYSLVLYFIVDPQYGKAQDYVDMLNNGTSFSEVMQAYDKAEAVAEIEAAMKAAEEAGQEYTGTLPEDVEVAAPDIESIKSVLKSDETYPSESFVKDVFAMSAGENKLITVSEDTTGADGTTSTAVSYYVVQKLDISADEAIMDEYSAVALQNLKGEEFEATLSTKGAAFALTENNAAIKRYTIDALEK